MKLARRRFAKTGKAARAFADFRYRTRSSWSRGRRVVAKAEYLAKGENPRFVVTSLTAEQAAAQHLYETLLRRGDGGQLGLFADRIDDRIPVESDPIIFFIDRLLCSRRAAAAGAGRDEDGAGAMHDDPAAAAQDRSADPDHGAQGVDFAGDGIRLGGGVRASV